MRIHKILAEAVVLACKQIFDEGNHANFVISQTLASDKRWGSRDRKFVAENIIYILKNFRFLVYVSNGEWNQKQDFNKIITATFFVRYQVLVDFYDFKETDFQLNTNDLELKVKHSFSDFIDEILTKDLGEAQWQIEAEASNQEAKTYLRVNSSKVGYKECLQSVENEGIEFVELEIPNCLELIKRQDVRNTSAYKNGWIEIQDAGSQSIGLFTEAEKHKKIIDACAGAGGKSLHLADLTKQNAQIVSMDIEVLKLKELTKRSERSGFTSIKTHLHQHNTLKKYSNWADLLLLDVPCSGLGVLKRNPDDKWKLTSDRLNQLLEMQYDILKTYPQMLKVSGILVYATCSIYSLENQKQIETFLVENPNFELIEQKQLFPSDGFDGFYMAKLLKNG